MFGYIDDSNQMNKHGIGLGLNISQRIIDQFGGQIEVHSKFGKGTTFKFKLQLFKEIINQSDEQNQDNFQSDISKFVYEWKPINEFSPVMYVSDYLAKQYLNNQISIDSVEIDLNPLKCQTVINIAKNNIQNIKELE